MNRRDLEKALLDRRAERMEQSQWLDELPLHMWLSPDDLDGVLVDDDPNRQWHVIPGAGRSGNRFMSIPLSSDPRLEPGRVRLEWPRGLTEDL